MACLERSRSCQAVVGTDGLQLSVSRCLIFVLGGAPWWQCELRPSSAGQTCTALGTTPRSCRTLASRTCSTLPIQKATGSCLLILECHRCIPDDGEHAAIFEDLGDGRTVMTIVVEQGYAPEDNFGPVYKKGWSNASTRWRRSSPQIAEHLLLISDSQISNRYRLPEGGTGGQTDQLLTCNCFAPCC